jgi:uncharacterized protein (DUF433 family)
MKKLDYRNIEKAPERCGGRAVVAGTRVRVATDEIEADLAADDEDSVQRKYSSGDSG